MRQKFHYVYKIIHIPSNRYYLGKHTTRPLQNLEDDFYMGSGFLWKRIIKKYPRDEFLKIILKTFDSKEEATIAERQFITDEEIANPLCLNLIKGGTGGDARNFSRNTSPAYIAQKGADTLKANPEKLKVRNEKIAIRQKAFAAAHPEIVAKRIADMNKTCKGTTKENNPNIQKQIEKRLENKCHKMEALMDRIALGEFGEKPVKEISEIIKVSVTTTYRMIKKIKNGQRTWFPL